MSPNKKDLRLSKKIAFLCQNSQVMLRRDVVRVVFCQKDIFTKQKLYGSKKDDVKYSRKTFFDRILVHIF